MADTIDPWKSDNITDYEHIFAEFGLSKFDDALRKKMDHYFFRRGIVVAHRDFGRIIERIENKKPFIQITGIATSGDLHFGHKADIDLFLHFKKMGAISYFAASDIDAYVSRPDAKIPDLAKAKEIAVRNVAHALALGVPAEDIYVQGRKEARYYEFAFELSKKITENQYKAIYGHTDLGKIAAVLLQIADILHPQLPEYEGRMPSITGIGLDQDPHARITRDVAKRLPYNLEAPSFIYFKHQGGLKEGKKMSSSEPDTAIFLSDDEKAVKGKIANSFTGGRITLDEQKRLGGQPEICKVYEMMFFHQSDDKIVNEIFTECEAGRLLCGDCKKRCVAFIVDFLVGHQKKVAEMLPLAKKIVYG